VVRSGAGGARGTPFLHLEHEEAEAVAMSLLRALQKWRDGGPGQVDAADAPDGQGYWVQAEVGSFPLIACARQPGQAYRPLAFASAAEAETAAAAIARALCPPADLEQEVYVNTRNFGR
jgi:hypothetical protein